MKYATVATGAVNGWLAAKLAQAGREVVCLARGAHLQAIRDKGLTLRDAAGAQTVARPAAASDDPRELGEVDVILFAVKAQDLEAAAELCRPLMGPETVVIPFLNGVEARGRLEAILGEGRVMDGLVQISVFLEAPGVIAQVGEFARFRFGSDDPALTARAEAIAADMAESGVDAAVAEDVARALWLKFLMLGTMSGLTAGARCSAGDIRERPELQALARASLAEIGALARACGVQVTEADEVKTLELIGGLPAGMKASQANDLEAGKPLEVDWLSGAVARMSEARGLDAPVHRTLHAVLTPFRDGAR